MLRFPSIIHWAAAASALVFNSPDNHIIPPPPQKKERNGGESEGERSAKGENDERIKEGIWAKKDPCFCFRGALADESRESSELMPSQHRGCRIKARTTRKGPSDAWKTLANGAFSSGLQVQSWRRPPCSSSTSQSDAQEETFTPLHPSPHGLHLHGGGEPPAETARPPRGKTLDPSPPGQTSAERRFLLHFHRWIFPSLNENQSTN